MKKKLVAIGLIGCMASTLVGCGSSQSSAETTPGSDSGEEVVEFRFVANKQEDLLTEILYDLAESIEEKSGGTLKPDLYLEGQLGSNDEDYCTGLSEGNYEMLCSTEWFQLWTSPEWMDLIQVPFIFRDADHLQAFWCSDIGAEINQRSIDQYNVYTYADTVALRGARYLTANKPVTSVEDVKGLKMRTPNVEGVVASWTAAGANVTPVAWGELYSALQTGVVDAQENPAANIDSAALYQVQSHLMKTAHQYTCYFIHMNNEWFNALSENQQKAITDSIDEAFADYNARVLENEQELFKEFEEKGMTIIEQEDIDIQSFKDVIVPTVLEQYKDEFVENGWDRIQEIQ